jgi:hypothetical protein
MRAMGKHNFVSKINNNSLKIKIMKKNIFIVRISLVLLLMSNYTFGQAPPLGATSSFALFTAAGAFANVGGSTVVMGDAGTNVGAFTGFPPGTLNGSSHVADPTSVQAAADVATAYSSLNGLSCGSVIGTALGTQTLTPNIYCLGAASTLNGNLTLDAQGNPNALFIIKINGTLSTASSSRVILVNSASLCNVFWQINGAVSLGTNSFFKGTIIANGAISLLQGASLEGRGLSTAGAISLYNNIVTEGTQPTMSSITTLGPKIFCAGGSTILSGNNDGTWNTGATTASITVNTSGNYFVTNTTNCGSITSNTISITVSPLPTLAVSSGTICKGSSITLSASGANSYSWSPGASLSSHIVSSVTANPTVTTIYTVTGTVGNCSAKVTTTVMVNISPIVNLGVDTALCGCIILNAYSPNATYNWSSDQNYSMINVCTTGKYWVNVSNGVCITTDTIKVTINPMPVVNIVIGTGSVVTLDAGNTGASFLWNTGATTQTINAVADGTYYVAVTNQYGCIGYDTTMIATRIVENISAAIPLKIYPNPSYDKDFTLTFETAEKGTVEIKIMNQFGLLVYAEKIENFRGSYNKKLFLQNLAEGIYFVEVASKKNKSVLKIVLD